MTDLRAITPVKILVALGHVLFAGLFILSLVHWRERVIHVDSAYQVFKWIQHGGLEVEAHRYSAIFPQIAVKLVRSLDAGLVILLVVASAMHVLVGWGVFCLAAHAWRTPWIAVASALAAVLCTRLTFFGIVLEANYLLSYPFLLAAALQGPMLRRRDRNGLLIATIALFTVLLAHPFGLVIALFVLGFFFIAEARMRGPVTVLIVLTLIWAGISRLLFPPTGYESELYANAWSGLSRIGELTDLASFEFLSGHTWGYTTHYVAMWLLFLTTSVLLVLQRAWLALVLVTLSVLGTVLLNLLTFGEGETAMMMEKNFLPVATMIMLPLVWAASRLPLRGQYIVVSALFVVSIVQFRGIAFAARPMSERYTALGSLVAEARSAGIRKAALPESILEARSIGVSWALPFETLLISSIEGPEHAISLIGADQPPITGPSGGAALPPYETELAVNLLQRHYYSLPKGPYVLWPLGSDQP